MFEEIRRFVKKIPKGKVATYGQVAEAAGFPRGSRQVAWSLKVFDPKLPWQRVIGKAGAHRGKILIEELCQANAIRCGYHGRRFDLSGKFLSMPEFEDAKNFPSEKDNLPTVPVEVWNKFLFASINLIAPLGEFLALAPEILQGLNLENLRFSFAKDYEVRAHWALYCENYLEGFHIPFVHQGLNEAIDYDSYKTETFRFSSL